MHNRALALAGVALIVASLVWLALLIHGSAGGQGVQVRSWLPTATAPR